MTLSVGSSTITFPDSTTQSTASALGVDQTWHLCTTAAGTYQRLINTTYTNSTGRAIAVSITSPETSSGGYFYINGSVFSFFGGDNNNTGQQFAIIPNGATYLWNGGDYGTIGTWYELR